MRALWSVAFLVGVGFVMHVQSAEEVSRSVAPSPGVFQVDLPMTLRLAGAKNLDVQIARQRLLEAKANNEIAVWQFFPAMVPGVGYRRHDQLIQDVAGNLVDVHKDSYSIGPTLVAQLDLGDAIYKKLVACRLVAAAEFAIDSQRQESVLTAALAYFELTKAQAAVRVAEDAVRIADNFARQLTEAVRAGLAFKGDSLRAEIQVDKNRLALRQAQEQVGVAMARLVQALHLDAGVQLIAPDEGLVPLSVLATNEPLAVLLARAQVARPEVRQSQALVAMARIAKEGARYGSLIPSLGAQVFAGGLGGGIDEGRRRFGASEDYQFSLGWRLGSGGLFDRGRVQSAAAKLQVARLSEQKVVDGITREVVENHARLHSLADQLVIVRHAVQMADEGWRLAEGRREFAVGVVLEHVQAEQDLTRARLDYLTTVSEFNKAQFALGRALGAMVEPDVVPAEKQNSPAGVKK